MRRIDTPTVAQDLFGPGKHGFRDGDPANAVLATQLNADHFNAVQEEIAGVIEGAGTALVPSNNGQLFNAIKSLFRSTTLKATEALLGVTRVGTQAEVNAGVLDDIAVTPKKLRAGVDYSFTSNGYLALPTWMGGWMLQWGTATTNSSGVVNFNFPTAFPNACWSVQGTPRWASTALVGTFGGSGVLSKTGYTFYACVNGTAGVLAIDWLAIGR